MEPLLYFTAGSLATLLGFLGVWVVIFSLDLLGYISIRGNDNDNNVQD